MKHKFLIVILSVISAYSQFSSGTDYSVKKQKELNEIGAVFHFEKNETEWKVNYGSGSSFTANSDLFGFGYGLLGKNSASENISVVYNADHYFREISNYTSTDTNSVTTNTDLPELSFQEISAKAGIKYKRIYGLYADVSYYSIDKINESASQFGFGADYIYEMKSKNRITLDCGFNISQNKDILNGLKTYAGVNPQTSFGIKYAYYFKNSELSSAFKYSSYDDEVIGDKESDYINLFMNYRHDFIKAMSSIMAELGTNLTSDFKAPEIYLPRIFGTVEFTNRLFNEKFNLTVGWEYGLYSSLLGDRYDLAQLVPDELSADEIKEDAGVSRLYIKMIYRY